jgi:hypothetical protein
MAALQEALVEACWGLGVFCPANHSVLAAPSTCLFMLAEVPFRHSRA